MEGVAMSRVRITTGRVMIAVTIVAALLATFQAGRRWERAARTTWIGVSIASKPYLYDDLHKAHSPE
jgi:hypothetical protein